MKSSQKKLFPYITTICLILPYIYHDHISFSTLFFLLPLGVAAWVVSLIIGNYLANTHPTSNHSKILLIVALTPWTDGWFQLSSNTKLVIIAGSIFALLYLIIKSKTSRFQYIATALLLTIPTLILISDWAKLHQILPSNVQTISGKIPAKVHQETYVAGKNAGIRYFLMINHIQFDCSPYAINKSPLDKLLCQDIYQHASGTVHIAYLPDNQRKNQPLSIQINGQPLWSSQQAQQHYWHKWQTFWHEFIGGIILISLPFTLLYCWAKNIIFRQPETFAEPKK